jgi:3-methyladenine DNA glycosylase AlkD
VDVLLPGANRRLLVQCRGADRCDCVRCIWMDVPAEKRRLLEQVQARADPAYAQAVGRAVSSPLKVHGLRVWEIREIVKGWRADHKAISLEDLLPLVETLWAGRSREERLMALELPMHYSHLLPALSWDWFQAKRQDLNDWELTDVLGVGVLGPWVAHDPERRARRLHRLVLDHDVWSRRLGLVATVGLHRTRKEAHTLSLALSLIDQVKQEQHPTITKAISWVLRVLSKDYPEQVASYLERNVDSFPRHVIREVRNKLETGRKNGKRIR